MISSLFGKQFSSACSSTFGFYFSSEGSQRLKLGKKVTIISAMINGIKNGIVPRTTLSTGQPVTELST
jgi:hypothetical protein